MLWSSRYHCVLTTRGQMRPCSVKSSHIYLLCTHWLSGIDIDWWLSCLMSLDSSRLYQQRIINKRGDKSLEGLTSLQLWRSFNLWLKAQCITKLIWKIVATSDESSYCVFGNKLVIKGVYDSIGIGNIGMQTVGIASSVWWWVVACAGVWVLCSFRILTSFLCFPFR